MANSDVYTVYETIFISRENVIKTQYFYLNRSICLSITESTNSLAEEITIFASLSILANY